MRLRPLRDGDAAVLAAYRSDPETARFQGWTLPYTVAQARELIAGQEELRPGTPGTTFQFALERRHEPGLIGDLMLATGTDPRLVAIGFTLAPDRRGRGYATEAVDTLLGALFATGRVHRVEARLDPRNVRSVALLDRLGFTREGTLRQSYWHIDGWTDDAVHGLLASEYRGFPPSGRSAH